MMIPQSSVVDTPIVRRLESCLTDPAISHKSAMRRQKTSGGDGAPPLLATTALAFYQTEKIVPGFLTKL